MPGALHWLPALLEAPLQGEALAGANRDKRILLAFRDLVRQFPWHEEMVGFSGGIVARGSGLGGCADACVRAASVDGESGPTGGRRPCASL